MIHGEEVDSKLYRLADGLAAIEGSCDVAILAALAHGPTTALGVRSLAHGICPTEPHIDGGLAKLINAGWVHVDSAGTFSLTPSGTRLTAMFDAPPEAQRLDIAQYGARALAIGTLSSAVAGVSLHAILSHGMPPAVMWSLIVAGTILGAAVGIVRSADYAPFRHIAWSRRAEAGILVLLTAAILVRLFLGG